MSNVEFIKHWFLENNFYLKDNPDKDEILNILITIILRLNLEML